MKYTNRFAAFTLAVTMGAGFVTMPFAAHASEEGKRNTAVGLGVAAAALLLTQRNKVPGVIAAAGAAIAYSQYDKDIQDRHRRENDYGYDNRYNDNRYNSGYSNNDSYRNNENRQYNEHRRYNDGYGSNDNRQYNADYRNNQNQYNQNQYSHDQYNRDQNRYNDGQSGYRVGDSGRYNSNRTVRKAR